MDDPCDVPRAAEQTCSSMSDTNPAAVAFLHLTSPACSHEIFHPRYGHSPGLRESKSLHQPRWDYATARLRVTFETLTIPRLQNSV